MFMGNSDFINSNDSETFWSLECDGLHLEDIPLTYPHQNLSVVLDEAYDVINSIRCLPYFGTYLGGYGGNMGSLGKFLSVDPDDGFLIIRLTSKEDDASVGVVANWAKEGQSFFTVECCYL